MKLNLQLFWQIIMTFILSLTLFLPKVGLIHSSVLPMNIFYVHEENTELFIIMIRRGTKKPLSESERGE